LLIRHRIDQISTESPFYGYRNISLMLFPFERVTGASQTEAAGLGLGLYLTAQLVKQQGGQIWVESREGMGRQRNDLGGIERNGAIRVSCQRLLRWPESL
jgi:hypothetical protein